VGRDVVALGELGLSGEVRRVPQLERRLHEAHRLGFKRAIVPAAGELKNLPMEEGRGGGAFTVHRVETLADAMAGCLAGD
jgi:DNA repair protein RadA/Sms